MHIVQSVKRGSFLQMQELELGKQMQCCQLQSLMRMNQTSLFFPDSKDFTAQNRS